MNERVGFLKKFKILASRKKGLQADENDLLAGILANGGGYGSAVWPPPLIAPWHVKYSQ